MPQPALTTGMDAVSNVDQMSFHFDREAKSIPVVFFHEPQSKLSDRPADSRTSRR